MIVGVCGYGFSGSGALLDLLNAFENIYIADQIEFSITYKPDGIEDLYRSIVELPVRYFSSDSSIRRFLQYGKRQNKRLNLKTNGKFEELFKEYVNSIVQVSWIGNTTVHAYQESGLRYFFMQKLSRRIRKVLEKKAGFYPKCNLPPDKKMYLSVMDEEQFMSITKKFIKAFIKELCGGKEYEYTVLDQAFPANNPVHYFKYYDDPRAIIINRDPRDIYLLAKFSLGMNGKFIPSDNVENFINYYKCLMRSRNQITDNRILEINFEDLVYDFESCVATICKFIGIDTNYNKEKTKFDPSKSINNTQLFLKHPEYSADISRIEEELGGFLYDFKSFGVVPKFDTKSF